MKKALLSIAALAFSYGATAQLPDGSNAPDFTATDYNGNTHTLSDYLADGKTVVIDIFATWCSPCWNYHNTGILEELYTAHGPDGDNTMMVFAVEGDGSTTTADLEGTGSNTTGNWIDGTLYPMIDDASIANVYQIAYYPTIYMICPDGTIREVGQQQSAQAFVDLAGDCPVPSGTNNAALNASMNAGTHVCGDYTPEVRLQNLGTSNLASCDITLTVGGNTQQTINWTGILETLEFESVTFNQVSGLDGTIAFSVAVTNVNGGSDDDTSDNTATWNVAGSATANPTVQVVCRTDNYPGETTWKVIDADNTVLGTHTYTPGNDDQWGGGGADALTEHIHDVTIPVGTRCITLEVSDSYGDGMGLTGGQIESGVDVVDAGTVLTTIAGDSFETSAEGYFKADIVNNVQDIFFNSVSTYPNPVENTMTLDLSLASSGNVNITVYNAIGEAVVLYNAGTLATGSHSVSLDMSNLSAGVYLVNINSGNAVITKKITVK